jgi:hypothetical protein
MPYQLTAVQKPNHLHVVVSGENSRRNVEDYLAEILRLCRERHCRRLLIEERLAGPRLDTANVFQIAEHGSQQALGHFDAIAYVDANAQGDLMAFAQTVATNRYLPVKVFATVHDAEDWLAKTPGGTA